MDTCFICNEFKKIRISNLAMNFGMWGEEFKICYKCSKSITLDAFCRKVAKVQNYKYPFVQKNDANE